MVHICCFFSALFLLFVFINSIIIFIISMSLFLSLYMCCLFPSLCFFFFPFSASSQSFYSFIFMLFFFLIVFLLFVFINSIIIFIISAFVFLSLHSFVLSSPLHTDSLVISLLHLFIQTQLLITILLIASSFSPLLRLPFLPSSSSSCHLQLGNLHKAASERSSARPRSG